MKYNQLQPNFQEAIDNVFQSDIINQIRKRHCNYEITWISSIKNKGPETIVSVLNGSLMFVVKDIENYEPGDYVILIEHLNPMLMPVFVKRMGES